MARKSIIGLLLFVVCGLIITAILAGETRPPVGMAAYFVNGQIISVGRHTLDLSKPVFVSGQTPVCPTEESLESYAPDNPGPCTVVSDVSPAGVVGITTDGMRAPSFQMQMQTSSGTIKGWVDYGNLHN